MAKGLRLLNQGYYLKENDHTSSGHKLGGHCGLDGAISPNSGRSLLQMAQLTTDSPELLALAFPLPKLPLLYGWSCAISDGPLQYRVTSGSVEIVEFRKGDAYDDFPYEDYPDFFPEISMHSVALTAHEQAAIDHANSNGINFSTLTDDLERILRPNHQLGGSPYVGTEIQLQCKCRSCGGIMNFVAAIGNNCVSDERGFMGNDYAQLLYFVCDTCHLISAENFCD